MNDPDVEVFASDGEKLSKLEQRAMLLTVHMTSLSEARRQLLRHGEKVADADVLALDEKLRSCAERVELLRAKDSGRTPPHRDAEHEQVGRSDDDLLQELLVPVAELASIASRWKSRRTAARYATGAPRVPGRVEC